MADSTSISNATSTPDSLSIQEQMYLYSRIEKIVVEPYRISDDNIRQWFKNFELVAKRYRVTNMNYCIDHVQLYLPRPITQLIPTFPEIALLSWKLFTEAIMRQFSRGATYDDNKVKMRLRQMKQGQSTALILHISDWTHCHSLLSTPLSTEQQVDKFLQSLFNQQLRYTLLSKNEVKAFDTLLDATQSALELERKGRWEEDLKPIGTTAGPYIDDEETTDIDHMDTSLAVTHHPYQPRTPPRNKGTYTQQYDREDKPICFYCGFRGHRHESKDCFHKEKSKKSGNPKKHPNTASVQQVDAAENTDDAGFSVCLTKVANTQLRSQKFV
ncbi:uncharacterized protein EV154DRAFT_572130 [Mucor mucedo]|uniref:uncharacterized protein n=1 Tax=Mucor mucedo TaxID=29922 RepID=UPI00221F8E61|nr:uncharacterized protein EV154DRAFT_572130 [Mucor mucedo]KAI7865553.1 hypothetical protein EV154DRAFT_572130 [Mucor mucedo]